MPGVGPKELQGPWGATLVCLTSVCSGWAGEDCGGMAFSLSSPNPCEEEQHQTSSLSIKAGTTWEASPASRW